MAYWLYHSGVVCYKVTVSERKGQTTWNTHQRPHRGDPGQRGMGVDKLTLLSGSEFRARKISKVIWVTWNSTMPLGLSPLWCMVQWTYRSNRQGSQKICFAFLLCCLGTMLVCGVAIAKDNKVRDFNHKKALSPFPRTKKSEVKVSATLVLS